MYKIKVKNEETGVIYWEYGFSKWLMKTLHFYFNETDNNFYRIYNVLEITKIVFNLKTFKKCLTNQIELAKI